ncbi:MULTISPECIES: hypothetical protein [Arthrobacter]|uniref:Potassium transporter Trk n=2 Tax=Arthrobacter TaxID=1663 RepID=A0ABU9KPB8_9MICC|nr:hypothetical protein [Arthrobacter sp. YJM1]MDP5228143.1 hypothetical protein [Arthrobacter sp. YJM1]
MQQDRATHADASLEERQITVRTAPKYVPFLVAGGLIGLVVAAISAFGFPTVQSVSNPARSYDPSTVFGFLAVLYAGLGVALGAVVALVLDRVGRRNSRVATVRALSSEENRAEEERTAAAEERED